MPKKGSIKIKFYGYLASSDFGIMPYTRFHIGFSILIVLFCLDAISQTPINLTSSDINNLLLKELENDALNNNKNELINVDGSIFLFDDFRKAEVITTTGTFNAIKVRYNIREDVFQFQMGEQILLLDPTAIVKRIIVDNHVFVVKVFTFQSREVKGFVEQLAAGKYSLYAKKNLTFRPAKPPRALESQPTPASYTRPSDTHYLELPNGKIEKVKNGKDIVFLAQQPKLENLVKSKKLSMKKVEDLVKIVDLLNHGNL